MRHILPAATDNAPDVRFSVLSPTRPEVFRCRTDDPSLMAEALTSPTSRTVRIGLASNRLLSHLERCLVSKVVSLHFCIESAFVESEGSRDAAPHPGLSPSSARLSVS
ncbi:hypothetical protein [Streptomyces sp. NPDC091219]|uniref:hypothetical protein n=1 Tax=Streptomyces sp. NPDC091219 TaxID=3155193 RepID=UPI003450C8B5